MVPRPKRMTAPKMHLFTEKPLSSSRCGTWNSSTSSSSLLPICSRAANSDLFLLSSGSPCSPVVSALSSLMFGSAGESAAERWPLSELGYHLLKRTEVHSIPLCTRICLNALMWHFITFFFFKGPSSESPTELELSANWSQICKRLDGLIFGECQTSHKANFMRTCDNMHEQQYNLYVVH